MTPLAPPDSPTRQIAIVGDPASLTGTQLEMLFSSKGWHVSRVSHVSDCINGTRPHAIALLHDVREPESNLGFVRDALLRFDLPPMPVALIGQHGMRADDTWRATLERLEINPDPAVRDPERKMFRFSSDAIEAANKIAKFFVHVKDVVVQHAEGNDNVVLNMTHPLQDMDLEQLADDDNWPYFKDQILSDDPAHPHMKLLGNGDLAVTIPDGLRDPELIYAVNQASRWIGSTPSAAGVKRMAGLIEVRDTLGRMLTYTATVNGMYDALHNVSPAPPAAGFGSGMGLNLR